MQQLIVSTKYNNKKLSNFIMDNYPFLKSNIFYKALRQKDIRINNIRVNSNKTLHTGDIIKIFIADEYLFNYKPLQTIYEDNNIIIINKPIGIEIEGENSLTSILANSNPNIFPCHRLDRNTSGLIIYAKKQVAREILLEKFKKHEIKKYYHCTIYGIPPKKHDILVAYLFKDRLKSQVYISDTEKKGYRKIITEYTIISSNKNNNTSELEVLLHTGRTHQIRAHLAHLGYPIIGDGKYGRNEINKQFNKKTQTLTAYKILFDFSTDAGILNYLNGKEIKITETPHTVIY